MLQSRANARLCSLGDRAYSHATHRNARLPLLRSVVEWPSSSRLDSCKRWNLLPSKEPINSYQGTNE